LEELADRDEDVALVAADLELPDMDGVDFLEQARELHQGASRVLLLAMDEYHTRIPFTQVETLQRATALGRIDFWIVKGWVTPEEWLYPQVQEALSAWTVAHRPHHVVLTGRDMPQPAWPASRPPLPFETSVPGVFAAGDVRYGSVKRVAGAVGEGSVTVGSVHRYLARR
jgi:CheY-like chemotaxis protein